VRCEAGEGADKPCGRELPERTVEVMCGSVQVATVPPGWSVGVSSAEGRPRRIVVLCPSHSAGVTR
jgi:hypothetical protein